MTVAARAAGVAVALTLADARAETAAAPSEALADVRAQIAALEAAVASDRSEFNEARATVLSAEKALASGHTRQAEYDARLVRKAATVAALRERRDRERDLIEQRLEFIRAGMLARYLLWRQPRIKLLLNQHDANAISRNIRFHDYFIEAYSKRIEDSQRELDQLRAVETALKLEADSLRLTRLESDQHLASLRTLKEQRGYAVAKLEQRLRQREQALAQLKLDEERLRSLVQDIGDALSQAPRDDRRAAFEELRGSLEWPAEGKIIKAPGGVLREGGAQWSGVVIESPPGAPVTAVGSGLVVFVDWFRNLGLLIIIDHGDGYMSLYGHNQSVQVESGTWVEAGEIISYVGDTGGQSQSGLYFEIRHDGQAQDPRQWCAAR